MFRGKIVVVGAGLVGSTSAFAIMTGGVFNEIVLIDINRDKAEGDAMDMAHGEAFVKPCCVYSGGYEECRDADIIVITAGANQKPGETRLELINKNVTIFRSVIGEIMKYAPSDVILLVVSNPVDVLTYTAYKLSGLPKKQVLGSGTVLDTARLKYMLSELTGIDARSCHTYIIGEHGDSEVAAWSVTNIAGMTMDEFAAQTGKCTEADRDRMYNAVKNSAYEIIEKKGATFYAIALAVKRITSCIAGEENSMLTVSGVLDGQYGLSDIALSVPAKVCGEGVGWIPEVGFSESEMAGLRGSGKMLKDCAESIGF